MEERERRPEFEPSPILVLLAWLWLLGGTAIIVQALVGLRLTAWLANYAVYFFEIDDPSAATPPLFIGFVLFGVFIVFAATNLLRGRDWARLSLAAVSWLAVAILGIIGVLLQMNPDPGIRILLMVALMALGPLGLLGLAVLYLTFLLGGPLPPPGDLDFAVAGKLAIGLALVPALSAMILHSSAFRRLRT